MQPKTIIFIFCVVDVLMGLWCLALSIQNIKMEEAERKFKNERKKHRFMGKDKSKRK